MVDRFVQKPLGLMYLAVFFSDEKLPGYTLTMGRDGVRNCGGIGALACCERKIIRI